MTQEEMLQILKQELVPALGCTEPVAIAYAAAKARAVLGAIPDRAKILVSRNILKNAMGVGIPGTKMVGLEMAAALGIIGGNRAMLKAIAAYSEGEKAEQLKKAVAEDAPYPTLYQLTPEARNLLGGTIAFTMIEGGTAMNDTNRCSWSCIR